MANSQNKIWIFGKNFNCQIAEVIDKKITRIIPSTDDPDVAITCIYAGCIGERRKELWTELLNLNINTPWMITGNFNEVSNQDEKIGENPLNINDVTDFNSFISQSGLIDGGYTGSKFTWTKNRIGKTRIMQRSERVLYSTTWLSLGVTFVMHLHRARSDRAPLLISC